MVLTLDCYFHLQSLPFDIPGNGEVPQDFYQSLYWLWCTYNQIAETDTYPPSADYEEVSINVTRGPLFEHDCTGICKKLGWLQNI